ncbi:unnamed protein product [Owenia fusiformis]|uniref:Uncharacterized protein n=1 Tax=Owenia fusiformis TaxID=6347 RepID=A0A8J1TLP9_OWEFU|nr:unnamed protein product [Owenia fusiformis]
MSEINKGFYPEDFKKQTLGLCACRKRENGENVCGELTKRISCSRPCWKGNILEKLPFIGILREYNLKTDLLLDILGGLTNGIMHIPQGMAFASLASLPPVVGLYVSFFTPIVYFFLGTSRHISLGTTAITSLLVGNVVTRGVSRHLGPTVAPNETTGNISSYVDWSDEETLQISLAVGLALLTGLIQLAMGLFHLGFVTAYLSDAVLSGFTTAAGFHVFTSQVKDIFGIKIGRYSGPWKLIYTYRDIVLNIVNTNVATLITSAICIIVLLLVKDCINQRFKSKMRIPIPIELFVVIGATVVSYFAKLNHRYGVAVVGYIPKGLPAPSLPDLQYAGEYIPDAFVIAIVGYSIHMALSKLFAKKHGYDVDSNQELIAMGMTNVSCSFFSCYTSACSMSRTLVLESAGGVTQICGLVSSILVMVVLLALSGLLYELPKCVLASIVMVAVKNMFKQFSELKRLWFFSKIDGMVWFVSWIATILLDTDLGLLVGVSFCILTLIFRMQWPEADMMGSIEAMDQSYREIKQSEKVKALPGIKIFRIDSPLCFMNREHFQRHLYEDTNCNPALIKLKRDNAEKISRKNNPSNLSVIQTENDKHVTYSNGINGHVNAGFNDDICKTEPQASCVTIDRGAISSEDEVTHVIVDCSAMGFIDSGGISVLNLVIEEYKEVDIKVILAGCIDSVIRILVQDDFFEKHGTSILYLSLDDAVKSLVLSKRHMPALNDSGDDVNEDTRM